MRKTGAAVRWLPVLGIIALLFGLPGGSAEARVASLTVTPGADQYGGTSAHWVVDGLPANQAAHLQRAGSLSAAWADVDNSFRIGTTNARGHLEFDFPTPAMNSVYFRVVTKGGSSEAHHFTSKHQDAEIAIDEVAPAEVKLPNGQKLGIPGVGWAITGEPFVFNVDTALDGDNKRVLAGRAATLQKRTIRGTDVIWTQVATGVVGRDGFVSFPEYNGPADAALTSGDYRVRLEQWTQGGDDIGWFVSFPFHLNVVDRPQAVLRIASTAPSDSKVSLTWTLPPVDPQRAKIVVTRSVGGAADYFDYQVAPALAAGATGFTDTTVGGSTRYYYAVYSVSADGLITRVPARTDVMTPAPPKGGQS